MSVIWYECKVKFAKTDENGVQKKVNEPYLLDAISYTEAESRIMEIMSQYVSEEFKITNIKVANYSEIQPFENADRWYKSKVALIAYDEESGKERKTSIYILVQANDIKEAYDNTIHVMQGTMGDYTILSIMESPIMDVFPYFSGEEEDLERIEKFNAVKGSKPSLVEMGDTTLANDFYVDEEENDLLEEEMEEVQSTIDFDNKEDLPEME